jgi:hypothetical protein
VLFYREPELLPGVYRMETIVYDRPTAKASVRYATVEVPKVDATKAPNEQHGSREAQ